jgi:hypothetical protein
VLACSHGASSPPAGGYPGGRSGLPENAPYIRLTKDEKAQFCDWEASTLGGYGKLVIRTCDDGRCSTLSLPDQATCVAGWDDYDATCAATVKDGEDCALDGCGDSCDAIIRCSEGLPGPPPGPADAGAD